MSRIVRLANFWSPNSGGLRVSLERLGRGLVEAGHDVTTVVPAPTDSEGETAWGRMVTLSSPRLPGGHDYRVLLERRRVRQLLEQVEPDSLEVSDKLSLGWVGSWARRHGVRSVLFSHERIDAILAGRVPPGVPLTALADAWNRRLASRFDDIVVTSAFSAVEYERIGRSPRLVNLGVDLDLFTPRSSPEVAHASLQLIAVTRLSAEKRPSLPLAALRRLLAAGVDAHLVVVGEGPLRSRLQTEAEGLPVTFTGHIADRRLLAALMAGADVGIAPCPAETFGLAPLEMLACGVPVVVTRPGGACELIDRGCGRAVDPEPAAVAGAVLDLAGLPPTGRRAAARARAEAFSWDAAVAGLLGAHGLVALGAAA